MHDIGILARLKSNLHPCVHRAMEKEYGSLKNALTHFQQRFGSHTLTVMTETQACFLDPIIIKSFDGKGLDFSGDHIERPWSISRPRPGSLTELFVKYGFLVGDRVEGYKVMFPGGDGGVVDTPGGDYNKTVLANPKAS